MAEGFPLHVFLYRLHIDEFTYKRLSTPLTKREKKNGSSVKCVDMRPKGHKHIAQGIALGVYWFFTCALLRAKA